MKTSADIENSDAIMGWKLSIDVSSRALEKQDESIDSFKATTRTLISSSSFIVALFSAAQFVLSTPDENYYPLYLAGFVMAIGFYLFHIVLCIIILSPTHIIGPINPDWYYFKDQFVGMSYEKNLETVLNAYVNAYEKNQAIVEKVRIRVLLTCITFAIVVVLLLGLSFLTRI